MMIPIVGVPFCNKSRLNRTVRIDRSNKHKIIVDMQTRTLDVPYGDHFYQSERWVVCTAIPTERDSIKVILQASNTLVFLKSTIFKNKIFTRSEVEIKAYFK